MTQLRRDLRLIDCIALVVGTIIGSGIFIEPATVARLLGRPDAMIAVWIAGGVLSLLGALAFAELGAMIPATGGQYVYLREAFGPLVAFLHGWASFLVIFSGAIAWLSVTFTMYLRQLLPLDNITARVVAVALIALITAVNYRGLKPGAFLQDWLTGAKLLGLAVIVVAAFLAPGARAQAPAGPVSLGAFGLAMVGCLLSYDGWIAVSFVAGEVRDPQRTLPRAILVGVAAATLAYVAANFAYLQLLTPVEMAASQRVGALATERALGPAGGAFFATLVLFSIAGAMNGWLLSPPRIYYAMAKDGVFFHALAEVHPRYLTPGRAILLQGAWAALIATTGAYQALGAYAMFAAWLFYGLAVVGLIVLRRTQPGRPRPYKLWGYPWTALLFALAAFGFVVNTLVEAPVPSLSALGLIAAGLPVYWFRRRAARSASRVA